MYFYSEIVLEVFFYWNNLITKTHSLHYLSSWHCFFHKSICVGFITPLVLFFRSTTNLSNGLKLFSNTKVFKLYPGTVKVTSLINCSRRGSMKFFNQEIRFTVTWYILLKTEYFRYCNKFQWLLCSNVLFVGFKTFLGCSRLDITKTRISV